MREAKCNSTDSTHVARVRGQADNVDIISFDFFNMSINQLVTVFCVRNSEKYSDAVIRK